MIYKFEEAVEHNHTVASTTAVSVHNDESHDLKAARRQAEEIINVSGAKLLVWLRTENADVDHVWESDADPTYMNPIEVKGLFRPDDFAAELTKWGVDAPTKATISFTQHGLLKSVHRMLRTGDVISAPYRSADKNFNHSYFRVVDAKPSGQFKYWWLYLQCVVEALAADVTLQVIGSEPIVVDQPLLYNESGVTYEP